jgi:hypothetical protein
MISHSVCVLCFFYSDEAMDLEDWKRSRSESSTAADELDSTYMPHKVCISRRQLRSLPQNHLYHLTNTSNCRESISDSTSFIFIIPYMRLKDFLRQQV